MHSFLLFLSTPPSAQLLLRNMVLLSLIGSSSSLSMRQGSDGQLFLIMRLTTSEPINADPLLSGCPSTITSWASISLMLLTPPPTRSSPLHPLRHKFPLLQTQTPTITPATRYALPLECEGIRSTSKSV